MYLLKTALSHPQNSRLPPDACLCADKILPADQVNNLMSMDERKRWDIKVWRRTVQSHFLTADRAEWSVYADGRVIEYGGQRINLSNLYM